MENKIEDFIIFFDRSKNRYEYKMLNFIKNFNESNLEEQIKSFLILIENKIIQNNEIALNKINKMNKQIILNIEKSNKLNKINEIKLKINEINNDLKNGFIKKIIGKNSFFNENLNDEKREDLNKELIKIIILLKYLEKKEELRHLLLIEEDLEKEENRKKEFINGLEQSKWNGKTIFNDGDTFHSVTTNTNNRER